MGMTGEPEIDRALEGKDALARELAPSQRFRRERATIRCEKCFRNTTHAFVRSAFGRQMHEHEIYRCTVCGETRVWG